MRHLTSFCWTLSLTRRKHPLSTYYGPSALVRTLFFEVWLNLPLPHEGNVITSVFISKTTEGQRQSNLPKFTQLLSDRSRKSHDLLYIQAYVLEHKAFAG